MLSVRRIKPLCRPISMTSALESNYLLQDAMLCVHFNVRKQLTVDTRMQQYVGCWQ
jgi:hypothetical protein